MHRLVLLQLLTFSILPAPVARAQLLPGSPKVTCRWGKPQGTQAIAGCGIPRRVHVTTPAGVARLMFAKQDNPTLTRYLYRSRAIGAPVKVFKRMVNVTKTDLVLCPADFQRARILAFRDMRDRTIRSRPTCELGKPGAPSAPAMRPQATPPRSGGGAQSSRRASATAPRQAVQTSGMSPGPRSVADALERGKPVTDRDLVKLRRALKMDTFARLLAVLALVFGVLSFAGLLLLGVSLRHRLTRLERSIDRSRAPDA